MCTKFSLLFNQDIWWSEILNKERFLELATNIGEFTSDEFNRKVVYPPRGFNFFKQQPSTNMRISRGGGGERLSSSFHGISLIARRRKGNNCCRAFFTGCLTPRDQLGPDPRRPLFTELVEDLHDPAVYRGDTLLFLPGNTIHRPLRRVANGLAPVHPDCRWDHGESAAGTGG